MQENKNGYALVSLKTDSDVCYFSKNLVRIFVFSVPLNFLPSNPPLQPTLRSLLFLSYRFPSSPPSQGRGALRPPHHSASPETRAPRCLHYTQQHRLLPE